MNVTKDEAVKALVEALNRQSASGLITREILCLTTLVQQRLDEEAKAKRAAK